MCPVGDLQRYKDNKLDRETCPKISIYFLKYCWGTDIPLQLWSSYVVASFTGSLKGHVLQNKSEMKLNFCFLTSRQQWHLYWAASRRRSPHVIIEKSRFVWRLLRQELCFYSVFTYPEESLPWIGIDFGLILQCVTCFWLQHSKIWSQINQIFFATPSCFCARHWIYRYGKMNQFLSLKLGRNQLLDILNILGGDQVLIHSFRHTKLQK